MVDTLHDPRAAAGDLQAHQQTFHVFSRLVLFGILHVMLVLGCLALAFIGHSPLIAIILGVGGTIALIIGLAVS